MDAELAIKNPSLAYTSQVTLYCGVEFQSYCGYMKMFFSAWIRGSLKPLKTLFFFVRLNIYD